MTDFDHLAQRYVDAWNQTDPAARRQAVEKLWSDGGRYVDPMVDVAGHDAIDATIAAVQEQFPDFVFRLAGPVDGHHGQARFVWELGPGDGPRGEAPVVGFDVVVLGDDGRMQSVLGFLDRVPAA